MTKLAAGYHHINHERPLIEQDLDAYNACHTCRTYRLP
jgi:hypothetical protein